MVDGWLALLSLFLGAGAGIVAFVGARLFYSGHAPREFKRWHEEVEHAAAAVVTADLHSAETKAHLFSLIGQLPHDFDPAVFLATRIGDAVQRAVLYKAEQSGIVVPGTFERVFNVPLGTVIEATLPEPPKRSIVKRFIGLVR